MHFYMYTENIFQFMIHLVEIYGISIYIFR